MTQITTALYLSIAENYADAYDQLQLVDDSVEAALFAIVDVTTSNYSPGDDAAVEIEIALLSTFKAASDAMTSLTTSTSSLLDAVRAVNGHVINNTSGTDTAQTKLDTWINSDMLTVWTSGHCPCGWALLSEDAGYTITNWLTDPSVCV